MTEIDVVSLREILMRFGMFNPNVRSLTAFNTDSKNPKNCKNQRSPYYSTTPRGGIISGTSFVMFLDGLELGGCLN